MTDVFKFDPDYAANEETYKELKTEILGEESSEEESGAEGDDDDDSEEEEVNDGISWSRFLTTTKNDLLTV